MRNVMLLLILLFAPTAWANGLPVVVDPPANVVLEHELLLETNAARARFGLRPLRAHEGLARAARAHSQQMAELGFFSHASPTPESATLKRRLARAGVASIMAGENLSLIRGDRDPAVASVEGWLQSPPHRAALLSDEYTHVGFGAFGNGRGEIYVAQVFSQEPRQLLNAQVAREARQGFDLTVAVEVPRPLTVVSRLDGVVGEPRVLEPGHELLELYASSGELQQLVLAVAIDSAGNYQIQDGGWISPASGNWQADVSMPRSTIAIAGVEARRAAGEVFRLDLHYLSAPGELAVFVDGSHVEGTQVSPGQLRVYLPSDRVSRVQVGMVNGSTVSPFDGFTVSPGAGGPSLRAGTL